MRYNIRVAIRSLKKKLDAVFSKYIRYRDKGQCYTCSYKNHPKKVQCGHFISRQYLAVRWDEVNCHAQCYACNMLYNGQPGAFATNLEAEYGVGTIARLEGRKREITLNIPYEALIKEYAEKLEKVVYE